MVFVEGVCVVFYGLMDLREEGGFHEACHGLMVCNSVCGCWGVGR